MRGYAGLFALLLIGCSTSHKHHTTELYDVDHKYTQNMPEWRGPTAEKPEPLEKYSVDNKTVQARLDANTTKQKYTEAKVCGDLIHPETNQSALNNDEAKWIMRLYCKTAVGKSVSNKQSIAWLGFNDGAIKRGQKGWLTRWRHEAAVSAQGQKRNYRGASPYICLTGQFSENLCGTETARVEKVEHFTSKESTYNSWK